LFFSASKAANQDLERCDCREIESVSERQREREEERERRHGKEHITTKRQITRDKVRLDVLLLPSLKKAALGNDMGTHAMKTKSSI
jgi:hypothetical protein